MKKALAVSVLFAAALLFGCAKNEVSPVEGGLQTVSFSPLTGRLSSKATVEGTLYKTTDPSFGTFAYFLAKGKTWDTDMARSELYIPVSEVSYLPSVSTWSTATPYYWPKQGSLTFFAYSPFKYQEAAHSDTALDVDILTGNDGFEFLDYNVDAHQDTDLMVADFAKDKTANGTNGGYRGVPIVFHHKLSQIVAINFITVAKNPLTLVQEEKDYANGHDGTSGNEYVPGDVVFKLKKVTLNDFCTVGTYGYTNTTDPDYFTDGWMWSEPSSKKTYTWFDKSSAPEPFADNTKLNTTYQTSDSSRNPYLMILPQGIYDPKGAFTPAANPYITIEYQALYYNGTSFVEDNVSEKIYLYDIHSKADSIQMNKKISYNFRISLEDRRIYWAPSVEDWESESFNPLT